MRLSVKGFVAWGNYESLRPDDEKLLDYMCVSAVRAENVCGYNGVERQDFHHISGAQEFASLRKRHMWRHHLSLYMDGKKVFFPSEL